MFEHLLAELPPEALAALAANLLTLVAAWLALWTALVVVALFAPPRRVRPHSLRSLRSTLF